jgi:hypothetical protein
MKRTAGAKHSVWRRAALALDEAPQAHWAYGLVHHGSRLLLLIVAAIAIFLLFPRHGCQIRRSWSAVWSLPRM